MFQKARIKLTSWYLLIIMLISISFSAAMYRALTFELDRVERIQRLRNEHFIPDFDRFTNRPPVLDPEIISETKWRIQIVLISVNVVVVIFSAAGGYFLAGRTLRPIKEMVDEQNRFVTDASHELRTPLTSLKSAIEVNLRDKKITLENAKKLLRSNLEDVNNLQTLSDGLIKLTQYRTDVNRTEFSKLFLPSLIDEAVKKVINIANNKKIIIASRVPDINVSGSKPELMELFVIFLDNAIKYSPIATKINITAEKTDGHVRINIEDHGIGIRKEDLPHIFERFYRADKSRTKTESSGYGLGLSIAQVIVKKHHGIISIQSKVNKGTKLTVILPA